MQMFDARFERKAARRPVVGRSLSPRGKLAIERSYRWKMFCDSAIIGSFWSIIGMIRVSSTEFGRDVGRYQGVALIEPVVVTRNGRDRTVMISAKEYRRLKRRDREVMSIADFTDADIEAVHNTEPSNRADAFNDELKPGA
jgi:PHD/YefM family antitoxin component YafN of YafNO toxin-antitoxin module